MEHFRDPVPVQLHDYDTVPKRIGWITRPAGDQKRDFSIFIFVAENRLCRILLMIISHKLIIASKWKISQCRHSPRIFRDYLRDLKDIAAVRNEDEYIFDHLIRQCIVWIGRRNGIQRIEFLLLVLRPCFHKIVRKTFFFSYVITDVLCFLHFPVKAVSDFCNDTLDPFLLCFHHSIFCSTVDCYHGYSRCQKDQKIRSQEIPGDFSFFILTQLLFVVIFPFFHLLTHPVPLIKTPVTGNGASNLQCCRRKTFPPVEISDG